jgi:predicted Zn-dependent peptidase
MILLKENSDLIKMVFVYNIGRHIESKKLQAQLSAQIFKKGTKHKTAYQQNEAIDFFGASIEIYASPLFITVEMYVLEKHFEKTVPLFFETLYELDINDNEWQILVNQNIEELKQQDLQNDVKSDKEISEKIYGSNSIYGYYSKPADYEFIQKQEVLEFHNQFFKNARPEIFISGNINKNSISCVEKQIEKYNLTQKFDLYKEIPSWQHSQEFINLPEKEKVNQNSVRLGTVVQYNQIDQWFSYEILNMALGGHFQSELMKEIRQNKGYTYGIYSYLMPFPNFATWIIAFETAPKNISPAVIEIKKIFERFYKNEKIINEAKKQLYGQWIRSTNSTMNELAYYVKFYKMGMDYGAYKQKISNYNDFQIENKEKEIFNFEKMIKVII